VIGARRVGSPPSDASEFFGKPPEEIEQPTGFRTGIVSGEILTEVCLPRLDKVIDLFITQLHELSVTGIGRLTERAEPLRHASLKYGSA
jgi:hypothetical protein